jgi:tripeptidyl-peptidase-1
MMGTSVIYSSGDDGVAGFGAVCLDSNRMFLVSLEEFRFVLTFLCEDQEVPSGGTVFNPEFPVGAPAPFHLK